jgi:hypothetical protein
MQINLQIDTSSTADLKVLSIIAAVLSGEQIAGTASDPVIDMGKKGGDKKTETGKTAPGTTDKKKDEKAPSIETVRAAVIAKSTSAEKKTAIKGLLSQFGADKVTALESKDYVEFLSQLENV